jgi:type IV pilus assembly protein PilQ
MIHKYCVLLTIAISIFLLPYPACETQEVQRYQGDPITLNLKDVDLSTVINFIARQAKLNVVLGDDVKGKVDVHLVDVPWDQALDAILKSKGLVRMKDGDIIRILTQDGFKRELELKRMVREEKESILKAEEREREFRKKERESNWEFDKKMREIKIEEAPLKTRQFTISYAKAEELRKNLEVHISKDAKGNPRGSIQYNAFTNSLIVRDTEENLDHIEEIIKGLDRPIPQILIEGRIVEISDKYTRDLGIQWGLTKQWTGPGGAGTDKFTGGVTWSNVQNVGSTGLSGEKFVVNFPASLSSYGGAIGITLGHIARGIALLDLQLTALESEDKAKILSTPKILTMDNQEATVKSGIDIPYLIPRELGAKPEVEFKEAVLKLTVTPHVISKDQISLNILATKDSDTGERVEGYPIIRRQQASTRLLVKNGETTVIGGLLEEKYSRGAKGVPGLSKIPILGWLFKGTGKVEEKRELLIFITPTILNPDAMHSSAHSEEEAKTRP